MEKYPGQRYSTISSTAGFTNLCRHSWKWTAAKWAFAVAVVVITSAISGVAAERPLLIFNGRNGAHPLGTLVFDAEGNLYGTTLTGGTNACNCGLVFRLTPDSNGRWAESILYSFKGGTDGSDPEAGVLFDNEGNLYGTTSLGGHNSSCCGTVFRLKQNSNGEWEERVLYRFQGGLDGANPLGTLVRDSKGNLYGTTSCSESLCTDYGTVYKLAPTTSGPWKETILHNFTDPDQDGSYPMAALTMDQAGNLYGTTSSGGPGVGGTVFELTPLADGSWNYAAIFSFGRRPALGYSPWDKVIVDASGTTLYGTTLEGGYSCGTAYYGCGIVFRLKREPSGHWIERVLHYFRGGDGDGANPFDGLVSDSQGNFFGTTFGGGSNINCGTGCGTVFELRRSETGLWSEDVLFKFKGTDGLYPQAGLVLDQDGNLFGTTDYRSTQIIGGEIFEVTAP